jgi:hypothetical protein
MRLDQALVDAAIELAETRWPAGESGGHVTDDGRSLTSVIAESPNEAEELEIEQRCRSLDTPPRSVSDEQAHLYCRLYRETP